MADLKTKAGAPRVDIALEFETGEALLRRQLAALGVRVPDQALARRRMEAARAGFPPDRDYARWRVKVALVLFGEKFRRFTVIEHGLCAAEYGGEMPEAIDSLVRRVRAHLLHARLWIYATFDDPWLEIEIGGATLILAGWYRPNRWGQTVVAPL